MTGYPIEVHWSDEDEAWIADVPDLPYCSAHGPTRHEAVAEVELAVEARIEAAGPTPAVLLLALLRRHRRGR